MVKLVILISLLPIIPFCARVIPVWRTGALSLHLLGGRASFLHRSLSLPGLFLGTLGICSVPASVGFICMAPLQCIWQWAGAMQILLWRSHWTSVHGPSLQSVCWPLSLCGWLSWGRLEEFPTVRGWHVGLCVASALPFSPPPLYNVTVGRIISPVLSRGAMTSPRCAQ